MLCPDEEIIVVILLSHVCQKQSFLSSGKGCCFYFLKISISVFFLPSVLQNSSDPPNTSCETVRCDNLSSKRGFPPIFQTVKELHIRPQYNPNSHFTGCSRDSINLDRWNIFLISGKNTSITRPCRESRQNLRVVAAL